MVYPPRDEIKICDFGFSQEIDTSRHLYSMHGTPEFVAPEVVHQEPVSVATDIWYVHTCLSPVTFMWHVKYTPAVLTHFFLCVRSVGVIAYLWYA